jgi:hypothetical protein
MRTCREEGGERAPHVLQPAVQEPPKRHFLRNADDDGHEEVAGQGGVAVHQAVTLQRGEAGLAAPPLKGLQRRDGGKQGQTQHPTEARQHHAPHLPVEKTWRGNEGAGAEHVDAEEEARDDADLQQQSFREELVDHARRVSANVADHLADGHGQRR